jgi:predicted flap endonuclease-1-like 5' DNA nuclease
MCLLCILLPVLVGLICAILGYLLGRLSSKNTEELIRLRTDLEACGKEKERLLSLNTTFRNDIDDWKLKFNSLQSDFNGIKTENDDWRSKYGSLKTEFDDFRLNFSAAPAASTFDAALAAMAFGKKIRQDDLKIVEGIGPKIEKLFHKEGITTWKALSETPVETCQRILDEAGPNYRVHKPETWPEQCRLAFLNQWSELKEWQGTLRGGRKE